MENDLKIRSARENEFLDIHEFVSLCHPLESYKPHFYKIMLRYFGDKCYVAEQSGRIIGFILGFLSQRHPGRYFLWQIGVHPEKRNKSLGSKLLGHIESHLENEGVLEIELTIDPENPVSRKLFESHGFRNVSSLNTASVMVNNLPAVKDYYSPGRHFMLYNKVISGSKTSSREQT